MAVSRVRQGCSGATARGQPIKATRQIMTNMLREVSSLIENLAMNRIPHYLIPLSLVQNVLTSATAGPVSLIQTHLAFSLGSIIPLYIDQEAGDLGTPMSKSTLLKSLRIMITTSSCI